MTTLPHPTTQPARRRSLSLAAWLLAALTLWAAPARSAGKPVWNVSVQTAYDSNIFLQDTAPDPAIVAAARPEQGSVFTTFAAAGRIVHEPSPALSVTLGGATEAAVYHSAASESHQRHRADLNLSGRSGETAWSLVNTYTVINGDAEGPSFGGPGGVTALGGIPLRDRRDAAFGRSNLKLTRVAGGWTIRPVAALYLHDFRTLQSRRTGYENYVDRREWTIGADFGREVSAGLKAFAGFRLGQQDQLLLHGNDSIYDNDIRRVLIGVEGTLTPWLQAQVSTGPDQRRYSAATPVGFDRDDIYWWIDATATVRAGTQDSLTLTVKRFLQPAFSSHSLYEDITYAVAWQRKFSPRFTAGAGFKAYGGDWPSPVLREDWIFTPTLLLRYATKNGGPLEFNYGYDRVDSRVPNTAGREYRRHLLSVSWAYGKK